MSGQAHNLSVFEQDYPACPGTRSVDVRDAGTANTNDSYIGATAVAGAVSGALPLENDKSFLAWVLYSGERTLTIREVRSHNAGHWLSLLTCWTFSMLGGWLEAWAKDRGWNASECIRVTIQALYSPDYTPNPWQEANGQRNSGSGMVQQLAMLQLRPASAEQMPALLR
jgi:hypothetical protein